MLHRWMSDRDREDLRGKRVSFTVVRDGAPVERWGVISRVTPSMIWISCFLYVHDELKNLREVR